MKSQKKGYEKMARPNRNNRESKLESEIGFKQTYRTAIYARLSIEDNGKNTDSIKNQILYLKKYIKKTPDLEFTACYQDNGISGTHFERAGFQAMMETAKRRKIDCIVVKDLSRFGRNYMETGAYLETIFPCLGIRFISVNDDYDSMTATGNELLALSVKNIAHHFYAKDISEKIRTHLAIKKKQGCYLGRYGPYGYKKSLDNPHRLEIDEETAPVVREIYFMSLKGDGAAKIARTLNDKGVVSPASRRCQMGLLKGTNGEKNALWSGSTILEILQNPIYCGYLLERKTEAVAFTEDGRQKRRKLSKKEWNFIKGIHDAIIDQETFLQIQDKMGLKGKQTTEKNKKKTENKFKGLVFCGICGSAMNRDQGYCSKKTKEITYRYICGRKYKNSTGCPVPNIPEVKLRNAITEFLNQLIQAFEQQEEWMKPYFQNLDLRDSLDLEDSLRLQDAQKLPDALKVRDSSKLQDSRNLPWNFCKSLIDRIWVFPKQIEIRLSFCLQNEKQNVFENILETVCAEKEGEDLWKNN
ncbi:MAG: recombinase family protein [Lachnospiraceae bacterium]|jgi:site-specific DNA recombinase|nr:recombinase family protein [Lachnospiraceae bacterium]